MRTGCACYLCGLRGDALSGVANSSAPESVLVLAQIFSFVALQSPVVLVVKLSRMSDFNFSVSLKSIPKLLLGQRPRVNRHRSFAPETVRSK